MITSFIDNFDSLAGWTVSGLAAAANAVAASVAGTTGTAVRDWGTEGVDHGTACFCVTPDKTDTAGRFAFVGWGSAAGQGIAAGYIAGTGIVVQLVFSNAPSANQAIIIPDAQVTTGVVYTVRLIADSTQRFLAAQVYDDSFRWIGGGQTSAAGTGWFNMNQAMVTSNSAASKISRVAFDPVFGGSATTRDFLTVDGQGVFYTSGNVNHAMGLYLPGRASGAGAVVIMCHGAGAWAPSRLYGSQADLWNRALVPAENLAVSFNAAGLPIYYPRCYSETGAADLSWAAPDAYAEVLNVIALAKSHFGSNVKIILDGYSMGGLMALRLALGGDVSNVVAVILRHAITGLVQAHADAVFGPEIESTWGTSSDATLAISDPHQLIQDHPERARGLTWIMMTASDDATASSSIYTDVFQNYLGAAGIPFTRINLPFGQHTGATPANVAADMTRQVIEALDSPVAPTLTLTITISKAGALTDADAVPTLSDSTATYGVRRRDTGDVVVPPGTPMNRVSQGVYNYVIESPVTGVMYDWVAKTVLSGNTTYTTKTSVANVTSVGLDATGVRAAIGMAEANLDVQLSGISGVTNKLLTGIQETSSGSGVYQFTTTALANGPSGSATSGSGPHVWTVTVNDGTNPIVGAIVGMKDGPVEYSATTDNSGVATFGLTTGGYTVSAVKPGYAYIPTTQSVSASGSQTISMSAVVITPPSLATQTVAIGTTVDTMGSPIAGVVLTFKMIIGSGTAGTLVDDSEFTVTSDVNGVVQVTLIRGATYLMKYNDGDYVKFVADNSPTSILPGVLGHGLIN